MYHAIVAKRVEGTFTQLSNGEFGALTDQLASDFSYRFVGDHALGGVRTTIPDIDAWFERVYRLFPGLRFDVVDTVVKGPPWRTVVLTQVQLTANEYQNEMFQRIDLAWGRITNIVTMEDLDVLHRQLSALAERGHADAASAPIVSVAG